MRACLPFCTANLIDFLYLRLALILRRWVVFYLVIIKLIYALDKKFDIKIINSKDDSFQGFYLVQLYMFSLYMFPQHVGSESGCLNFISISIVLMEAIAFLDGNIKFLKNGQVF